MEELKKRHQLIMAFLEALGMNEVRLERLPNGSHRYYGWCRQKRSKKPLFWSTLVISENEH